MFFFIELILTAYHSSVLFNFYLEYANSVERLFDTFRLFMWVPYTLGMFFVFAPNRIIGQESIVKILIWSSMLIFGLVIGECQSKWGKQFTMFGKSTIYYDVPDITYRYKQGADISQ